eukprot:COSAG01_NODE_2658_length_7302_cov_4.298626_9_plen_78_part_00
MDTPPGRCVVAKMLSQDEINPFNNPSMSGYRSHEGVAPWHELLTAYQQQPAPSIEGFSAALGRLLEEAGGAASVASV